MNVHHQTLDNFSLVKCLGAGATCEVYLAQYSAPEDSKTLYAIKMISPLAEDDLFDAEVSILRLLDHPNIVKVVNISKNGGYKHPETNYHMVRDAIVFEYAPGGDLFDYVRDYSLCGILAEKAARTLFKMIISGVKHCHEKGVTHRDLKLENILFDENYSVKIADFGYAAYMGQGDDLKKFKGRVGTLGYQAPEIVRKKGYDGKSVDVFACGVILFLLVRGSPPFQNAHPKKDSWYSTFCHDPDLYWHAKESNIKKEQSVEGQFFSPVFRDLVSRMLCKDPEARLTLEEIEKHPWYLGPVLKQEDLGKELSQRRQKSEGMKGVCKSE